MMISRTARLRVVYMSIQSVLVILTLARWMAIASAVPRIGVIVRTLRQAATVLTELTLVFLMMALPIGISLIMTVGSRVEDFSSPHKMLQRMGEESIACATALFSLELCIHTGVAVHSALTMHSLQRP